MSDTTEIKSFGPLQLTTKGHRLLAKAQTGVPLNLTRPVIGDGYLAEGQNVLTLTELVNEIPSHQTGTQATSATADLTRKNVIGNGTIAIYIRIKNGDTAFYLREIGLMAEDPDEGEILYAYSTAGDSANSLPAFDGTAHVIRNLCYPLITTNSDNVNVNITLPAEITYDEFQEEFSKVDKRLDVIENVVFDDEYGMRWTTGASAPEVERCIRRNGTLLIGANTGLTFSVNSDGSFASSYSELPIWGEIERIMLKGQVMVRIPKYYIKREVTGDYTYTWVCKKKKAGYRCAAIFLQADGTENDYYYVGAYESTNDALGVSASGKKYDSEEKPYSTGWTITEYRNAAKAIGDGWGITPMAEVGDLWQVLLPIEFGTRDVQSVAAGVCAIVDPPVDDNFPDVKYRTGMCDKVKNLHGIIKICENSPANSVSQNYNYNEQTGLNCGANPWVWHGIENPYGCVGKWIDGLTLYNQQWYTSNDREVFATNTVEGYKQLTYTPPEGAIDINYGYVKALSSFTNAPYCQLPTEFTDTEYTYFSDEFYYGTGNGYLYGSFGGDFCHNLLAGVWCVFIEYASTYRDSNVGSRLSYSPV